MSRKIRVFDIKWDLYDEELDREVDPEEEGLPETEELEIYGDCNINTEIAEQLSDLYGFPVKSFGWNECLDENDILDIKKVLRKYKYFEGNEEFDPNFSAQDAIDEIAAIVGM